jgi:fido (protein-threonine AMPylation protein)
VDSSYLTQETSGAPRYTAEENEQLTLHLEALTTKVHAGVFSDRPITGDLLRELHGALFDGVRDHAGRTRSATFGHEYLTFGPNRSFHRTAVERGLSEIASDTTQRLRELEDTKDRHDYDELALRLALDVHARIIEVHPFEDGNGRSTRLLMGIVLVRLGLHPIPIEACKQEYTDALNIFFKTRNDRPLVDLFLRLYED